MSGLDDMPLEGWYAAISAALRAHDVKASVHCEWCSKGRTRRRQNPQPEEDQ